MEHFTGEDMHAFPDELDTHAAIRIAGFEGLASRPCPILISPGRKTYL
jgi:hypothetical protein